MDRPTGSGRVNDWHKANPIDICGKLPQTENMSQSIRISDELIEEAKRHAKLHHRSPPQQIEHWAAVGRVMEVALAYPAQEKVAQAVTGKQLDEALALVGTEKGRERAREIINKPKTTKLK